MDPILTKLGEAVEAGKVDKNSPFPPQMKGEDGADEGLAIHRVAERPRRTLSSGVDDRRTQHRRAPLRGPGPPGPR